MNRFVTYLVGFLLSLALTLAAFLLAAAQLGGMLDLSTRLPTLLALFAVAQLVIQVACFLHLSEEHAPRWRLLSLLFALLVAVILIGGTLWIMQNLGHGQVKYREIFKDGALTPQAQND